MADEPLTHLSYQILLSLVDRPCHGYGIIKEIEERPGGGPPPSTGALYLALQRLEADGSIEPTAPPPDETDGRRKYYRLTEAGRALARSESLRLARLVDAARAKDLLTGEAG